MATTAVGSLQEFQPEQESIAAYLERFDAYIAANAIPAARQVSVLISVLGNSAYSLLRSLTAPTAPKDKTLADLKALLIEHFEPKPILIAERFRFYKRHQGQNESLSDYLAELRKLASTCGFEGNLEDSLRDSFVCGLRSETIQKRLLAVADLKLPNAVELARNMETATRDAKSLQGGQGAATGSINKLNASKHSSPSVHRQPRGGPSCFRCSRSNHTQANCKFLEATCHNCGQKGHISPACRKPQKSSHRNKRSPKTTPADPVHHIGPPSPPQEEGEFLLLKVDNHNSPPLLVQVLCNDQPLIMELDTGAAVSIISDITYRQKLANTRLCPSKVQLKTYTQEAMHVLGEITVEVNYKQHVKDLKLVVVQGNGPSLLGRNWIDQLPLDWPTRADVVGNLSEHSKLALLLEKYQHLWKEGLGTITSYHAALRLKENAKPRFFKPRSVPYAVLPHVEEELDRLKSVGAIEPVDHSEWAAPIVLVPKKDRKFRLCGDYKVTINQALEIDQYPLPKPEDLFASLAGGQRFTKLDLSQAYQQLTLDENSRKLVTINTHKGLYRFTRLPFGVASAPAIFQRFMDSVLAGLSHVICYLDDILVTGSNDEEHFKNLEEVFKRLDKHKIRIKRDKCKFMESSVEYLGHQISADGISATNSKLKAITEAPVPQNIQELRSFLGLLNYYGKFVPNLSTLLHPLNQLLQHDGPWLWSKDCQDAFQNAKKALVSSQVLIHYDPNLPISLAGDASAYGVGAVISHTLPDGSERPIAFASRTLSSSERNYSQIEKEALSLIFGVKKFHTYLYVRQFTLFTDHKPLTVIFGSGKGIPTLAAARLQRWALLLSAYQFDILYKSTSNHSNADGLSRLPLPECSMDGLVSSQEPSIFNINQISVLPISVSQIETATRTDSVLSKVLLYTKQGWPSRFPKELQPYHNRVSELSVEGDCVMWGMRVVVPAKYQSYVLQELHKEHPGMTRMKKLARSYVWWPGLDKDIENQVQSCNSCQRNRTAPADAPLHPWVWPKRPCDRIHIDFAGPFMDKNFLIVVDAYSKWPEVFIMPSTTASATINVLRKLFSSYGLPLKLVSDNGPQFVSEEFELFLKSQGVKHILCSPYHPASNGLAERFVQSFKHAMKVSSTTNLQHRLDNFLFTYRITPHATTGRSPSELFLNRTPKSRLDLLRPNIRQHVEEKQFDQSNQHNAKAKSRVFTVGQTVMARNFRAGDKWVPGVIVQCLGPLTFLIEVENGLRWKRHVDHVLTYNPADGTPFKESDWPIPNLGSNPDHIPSDCTPTENVTPTPTRYPSRLRRAPDRLAPYVS